ncbi:MAG: hypothetical protein JWO77_1399 [Ilumatobacteraceae bacterium]|nr:hypothetical protein [Ilumatobacteraceae bacterium]
MEPVEPSVPEETIPAGEPVHRSWPAAPFEPLVPGLAVPSAGPLPLVWTVKRRWIPRLGADTLWARFWRRFRRMFGRAGEAAGSDLGCAGDVAGGILAAIVVAVVLLVVIFIVFPAVVAVIDLAILLILALGGLIARVCFRRPWLIDARDGTGRVLRWRVVGWKASSHRVEDIRHLLADGMVPPDAEVFRDPVHEEPD